MILSQTLLRRTFQFKTGKVKKGCCFGKVKTPKENTLKTSSQDEEEKSKRWPDTERTV